jgi:hypothetical protein
MPTDILRWFGIIKKRNGKFIFTCIPVSECESQYHFLHNVLKMERGDTVIELLQNSTWQPKDFVHYCNYHYVNAPPPKEKTVTVPISQYK